MPDTQIQSKSAEIGADFSSYQGSANLGGGSAGVFSIDTKPLEQLAVYTNLYNKTLYEQQQKDADAAVAELAKTADIDVESLHGKDKEIMKKKLAEEVGWAAEFAAKPIPTNPSERIAYNAELKTHTAGILNNWTTAKARTFGYQSQFNTIQQNTTKADLQDVKKKQLEDLFNSTDISTPIPAAPNYKLDNIEVPNPATTIIPVESIGGDQNVSTKVTVYNPFVNARVADGTLLNIKQSYVEKKIKNAQGQEVDNPEYTALPQSQKDAQEQQATADSSGKLWSDMTEPLNVALHSKDSTGNLKYFSANGTFNESLFTSDNASNSTIMNAYSGLKALDNYSRDHYNQAVNGTYTNKGLPFKLPSDIKPDDFKAGFINWQNGVNPNQLVQAGMFSKFGGDAVTHEVKETGKATTRRGQDITAQTAREGHANSMQIAKLPYEYMKKAEQAKIDAAKANGSTGAATDETNIMYAVKTDPAKNEFVITPTGKTLLDKEDSKPIVISNGIATNSKGEALDLHGVFDIPVSSIGDQVLTEYNKYAAPRFNQATGTWENAGGATIKPDPKTGLVRVKFEHGEIVGYQTTTNADHPAAFVGKEQFKTIGDKTDYKGVKKGVPRTDIGVEKGKTQKFDEYGVLINQ